MKFDDAKPGTLEQVKAGDQLRARGTKSEDGKETGCGGDRLRHASAALPATVISTDAANNTITVTDLVD